MAERHRDDPERDAILAELAALGEAPLEDEELGEAAGVAGALDALQRRPARPFAEPPASDEAFAGARLLLGASSSSALGGRSEALFASLSARLAQAPADEASELLALGEAALEADEAQAASVVASVADGVIGHRELPAASLGASLPTAEPVAALQLLRVGSPDASLSAERSDALYRELHTRLPQGGRGSGGQVVPLRRGWPWGSIVAAAAAVLMVVGIGGIVATWPSEPALPTGGPVAQVELDAAEQHLGDVERESLQTLMGAATVPTGESGDHYLRPLREARSQAMMARVQARERRL